MMLLDRRTTTEPTGATDSVSAAELSARTAVAVTGVPHGPTGLWDALAQASVRRARAELDPSGNADDPAEASGAAPLFGRDGRDGHPAPGPAPVAVDLRH